MADKTDLLHLPQPGSSLLIRSEAHSSLIARGRKDAASLIVRRSEQSYRAIVRIRTRKFDGAGKRVLPSPPQRCGLIDETGKFVVEPIYHELERFSCGLAAFSVSPVKNWAYDNYREELFNSGLGLWGYLDPSGQIIICPRFERAREFSEGLAAVALKGKWGFVCMDGSFALEPRYDGALSFNDGLARVMIGQKCGFIDKAGRQMIAPRFDCLLEFSEGLSCAQIAGKQGYIDRNGVFAIEPQFDPLAFAHGLCGRTFRYGIARVLKNGRDRLIDRAGNVVFQCAEDGESISEFSDGIARVHDWDHAYFIDSSGQPLLRSIEGDEDGSLADELDAAEDFSEGLGLVAGSYMPGNCDMVNGDSLWPLFRNADRKNSIRLHGFIDTQGNVRIPPRFHSAHPFKEGLAAVDPNGREKYGFIDATGAIVIEPRFTDTGYFTNGMARVREDSAEGKWGFIDKTGRIVIPYQFDREVVAEGFQQVVK